MAESHPPSSNNLVTTDWLSARLGEPGLTIVDSSFYRPALKRDAKAEFRAAHIPGAVFFDIDAIADNATDLPHMLRRSIRQRPARSASGQGRHHRGL